MACAKLSRSRPDPNAAPSSTDETAHVSMVGTVGADAHGAQLTSNLAAYGVDVSGVNPTPAEKTGIAMIIVDNPTGENRIVLSPGANHALQPADFSTLAKLTSSSSSGSRLPDLLIMQLEIPFDTVLAALAAARREGVDVLLNPAPARALPDEAYPGLAHLVVNETEAATLGGVEEAVLDDEAGLEAVAERFVNRGARNVIITLGGRGVYYLSGGDGRRGLVQAEKAKVVDTTAAGDTFVGRYALEVVRGGGGFNIEQAVRKANKAAAKTVERAGAQDSIPWRDELE